MATVKDIAEKVGVSATTVSIVLNGKSEQRGITKATQEKIYQAMRELGYQHILKKRPTERAVTGYVSKSFFKKTANSAL